MMTDEIVTKKYLEERLNEHEKSLETKLRKAIKEDLTKILLEDLPKVLEQKFVTKEALREATQ